MQIVTDRGCDLSSAQLEGKQIEFVPMYLQLDGKTYSSGVDVSPAEFYDIMSKTESYPATSQAAVGDFVDIYTRLAKNDPEIFSMHISSGLSGTLNSARAAAEMVPQAKVTFWDTMTLSAPEGFQVEAAAAAFKAGWPMPEVLALLDRIRKNSQGLYTLDTLKYLIHGGRISHMKGLLASLLGIRPVIGVEKVKGMYITYGQERTSKKAIQKMVNVLQGFFPSGETMRIQLLHGKNLEGVALLKEALMSVFDCRFEETLSVAPVLGAHTGGSVVGLAAAPVSVFEGLI